MVVPEQFGLTMWRKPDRTSDQIGPAWPDVRAVWAEPVRRRRAIRWAVVLAALVVLAAVVGAIFLPGGTPLSSWGFLAAISVTAAAIVLLLARLVLGSLLPFEIGRGVYRWLAEKRRHRAWSKQAAQRDLFKR